MIPPIKDVGEFLPPALEAKFPGAVLEVLGSRGELYLRIASASLLDVCLYLRDEERWGFNFLAFVSGVDWLGKEPRFEVVYHLRSLRNNMRVGLKVDVPDETVALPSVSGIWKTADWLEREVFDLFGIRFTDHPDLRRIMMPDDWEGHPYRKDYPLEGRG
jgi:NADH-quinone oxidoreductase subunit C